MYCTNCGAPLREGSNFCTNCGTPLNHTVYQAPAPEPAPAAVQTAPEPTPMTTAANQVWNTPAETTKNTRHAFVALGIAAVLIVALVVALCLWVPSLQFDFDPDDWFSSTEPEPERELVWTLAPAAIEGTADDEFLSDFRAAMTAEWDYDDLYWANWQQLLFLEQYRTADFADPALGERAAALVNGLEAMENAMYRDDTDSYINDYTPWLEGWLVKCSAITDLNAEYALGIDEWMVEYYAYEYQIATHELSAENDLTAQLIGIDGQWDSKKQCYYITYTNNTQCEMDVVFYNDYETEDDYLWEEDEFNGIAPGDTVKIWLEELPEDYEYWYISWTVRTLYFQGTDIYDYYDDYDYYN